MIYIENNLVDSDGNMYLTVDSLTEIINIIIGSNNITLTKVNLEAYRFDKMYIDKDIIKDELYKIIDQLNERKITPVKFYSIFPSKLHSLYYGNGRTYKILLTMTNIKMNLY